VEVARAPLEHDYLPPAELDGVALVRWPEEADRAEELARIRAPRLLLVAPDIEPPLTDGLMSDWVRRPSDERGVQHRVVGIRRAASANKPIVDDHGVIWRGEAWTALSPIEARLVRVFLSRPGRVISRGRLEQAGWPDGPPNARAIDARMKMLRRRVAPLGLRIHTVRGQGYLAEIEPTPSELEPAVQ